MGEARVIKVAADEDGQAWAAALADESWRNSAELLKRDRDTSVWRAHLLGRDVVVKCWSLRRLKRRVQALMFATPAERQWKGAALLFSREIPTARAYALASVRLDDGNYQCLVLELLPGKSVLEHMAMGGLTTRQEHTLATALGRQILYMILARVYNRDHKPSNLIVNNLDTPMPFLIDTVGIASLNHGDDEPQLALQMLADLLIEPTGCKCPPRRALMLRAALPVVEHLEKANPELLRKQLLREAWAEVAREMKSRGDLTPKVDPLSHVRRFDG